MMTFAGCGSLHKNCIKIEPFPTVIEGEELYFNEKGDACMTENYHTRILGYKVQK